MKDLLAKLDFTLNEIKIEDVVLTKLQFTRDEWRAIWQAIGMIVDRSNTEKPNAKEIEILKRIDKRLNQELNIRS